MRPRSGRLKLALVRWREPAARVVAVTIVIGASLARPGWAHAQCCGGGAHASGHASRGHGGSASTNLHAGHGNSANTYLTPFPYSTGGLWKRSAHPPHHLSPAGVAPTSPRPPYFLPGIGPAGLSKPLPLTEHGHPPVTTGPATSAPQPVRGFSGPRGPLVLRAEARSISGTVLRTLDMRVPYGAPSERPEMVAAPGRGFLPGAPNPLTNIAPRDRSSWTLTGQPAFMCLAFDH